MGPAFMIVKCTPVKADLRGVRVLDPLIGQSEQGVRVGWWLGEEGVEQITDSHGQGQERDHNLFPALSHPQGHRDNTDCTAQGLDGQRRNGHVGRCTDGALG